MGANDGWGVVDKHFINAPTDLVLESLEGLCSVNHQLALDRENKGASIRSIPPHSPAVSLNSPRMFDGLEWDSGIHRVAGPLQSCAPVRRGVGA